MTTLLYMYIYIHVDHIYKIAYKLPPCGTRISITISIWAKQKQKCFILQIVFNSVINVQYVFINYNITECNFLTKNPTDFLGGGRINDFSMRNRWFMIFVLTGAVSYLKAPLYRKSRDPFCWLFLWSILLIIDWCIYFCRAWGCRIQRYTVQTVHACMQRDV